MPSAKWKNKKKQSKFDNAYWFSENLILESRLLPPAVTDLLDRIYRESKPQRKQPKAHLPQLEILILNLLKAAESKDAYLVLPMSSGAYSQLGKVSYRILIKHHIEHLIEMGWLEKNRGYFFRSGGRLTRIGLKKPILDWLKAKGFKAEDVERSLPKSCLLFKNEKKEVIEIPAVYVKQAAAMEDTLSNINKNLEKTFVDLFADDYELFDLNERMREKHETNPDNAYRLDLSAKFLTRIFNNGSLEEGGRFYFGWWQSVPKDYRPLISINGDFTTEMDYSSIHVYLLYALSQSTCPYADHYVFGRLAKEYRAITKTMFMILVNAESESSAIRAAMEQGLFDNGFPDGIETPIEYIQEIYKFHAPIAQYFGTGYGVKLQYLDSQIAESVMQRMLPEPCLPIHDSFIVRVGQSNKLKKIMNEEFYALTGLEASMKVKLISLSKERKQIVKELVDNELTGYSSRLLKWRKKYNWRFFTEGGASSDVPQLNIG